MPDSGNTYLQASGLLCVDAKNATTFTAGAVHDWDEVTDAAYRTGTAVQCLPDNGTNYITAGDANAAKFEIDFIADTTGTHYVWIRTDWGGTNLSDSFHWRLGGGSWNTWNPGVGTLTWRNVGTVSIGATGAQSFEVAQREDGVIIDAILLTSSAAYDPSTVNSGLGPAESAVQSAGVVPPRRFMRAFNRAFSRGVI